VLAIYLDGLPVRQQSPIQVATNWQWLNRELNLRPLDCKSDTLLLHRH